MVRIYISPDSEPLWVLKEPDAPGDTSTSDMLAEAERLLNDAPPAVQSSAKWEVLHCMILVATRTPESLDEAVTRLAAVLEADGDNIPALATLSAAFFNGGEPSKARNQLKRLLKLPAAGPGEFADESVDAWLMLAAINADSGKPDMAADCVQRALALDAGAGRAWEYLGTLAEKELRYAGEELFSFFFCVCEGFGGPLGFFRPSPFYSHFFSPRNPYTPTHRCRGELRKSLAVRGGVFCPHWLQTGL
jgi:tetratricopeptide (TPR) repeat protein